MKQDDTRMRVYSVAQVDPYHTLPTLHLHWSSLQHMHPCTHPIMQSGSQAYTPCTGLSEACMSVVWPGGSWRLVVGCLVLVVTSTVEVYQVCMK